MAAAFQKLGSLFGAAGFGSGDSGGFGLMPFGGGDHPRYVIPTLQFGSDDPTRTDHSFVGELVLERDGVTIAARKFAERLRWRFVYRRLFGDDLINLKEFWRTRRFLLFPDVDIESTSYTVRWVEQEFRPVPRYNGLWELTFHLEEAP